MNASEQDIREIVDIADAAIDGLVEEGMLFTDVKLDKARLCLHYSIITIAAIKNKWPESRPLIQAGSAFFRIVDKASDDGESATHFSYVYEDNQQSRMMIRRGKLPEMHCWVVEEKSKTFIDLTTRYIPSILDRLALRRTVELPPIVWTNQLEILDAYGFGYSPTIPATCGAIFLGSLMVREGWSSDLLQGGMKLILDEVARHAELSEIDSVTNYKR